MEWGSVKQWMLSWFGLVCLFEWHINLWRLFNAKAVLQEEQLWYYLTRRSENKGVHIFPKGICPKVNVIKRLEFELTTIQLSIALTLTPREKKTEIILVIKSTLKSDVRFVPNWYNSGLFVCLFVLVLWHINLSWLFNAKSIFIQINSSISNNAG